MKRITSFIRLLVCLIFMAATTQHALAAIDIKATKPANGSGTAADPYQIGTPGELYWFANQVNNGQNTISAKLTADIVVNENVLKAGTFTLNVTPTNVWTPIGKSGNTFKGTFDGNGHTISGLYFNNTTNDYYPAGGKYIGLIGVADGATIKNVVVKDSYLYGSDRVSGICGCATGSTQITNCGYEGVVYGSSYACGIAYNPNATVENCYSVSNKPLSNKEATNCYHDNNKYTSSTTYSTGKPSAAFASGEVAFLLGEGWGQKIGTDATPRPGGDKVYESPYSGECPGAYYSNDVDKHGVVTERNHNCNEEGLCIQCGFHLISTADQLYAFAAKVNAGQTTICAKLTADIVVNENVLQPGTFTLNGRPSRSWTPIGKSGNKFKGTFDGNGHTISGLYFLNTTNSDYSAGGKYIGLIGYAEGATIKNVVVKDSYIIGYQYVAGICGYAAGSAKITNCGYEGHVNGNNTYGIAYNYSATVENCYIVSSKPLSNKATTNCYHDNNKYTSSTTESTGKSSEVFASGEVAWLLGDAWGQKIGTDVLPIPGGDKVYKNTYSGECPGEGYSNVDEHGVVTERNHNCNAEGLCMQCGLYFISTADQLYAFAAKVNAGQTTISAKLAADIVVNENVLKAGTFDLNGTPSRSWTPIGKSGNNFKGTFDGNGHTISGLYFNNTTNDYYPAGGKYIGLIGYANGATIKNVVVKDSYLYDYQYVAGICGFAAGSTQITNCGYEGYVSGNYSYGIVYNGYEGSAIKNCYSVSNKPLAYKATTNCYHDNNKYTSSTSLSTGMPSTAFATGEVAFLLGESWGQKIGTDVLPIPGRDKVYKNTYSGECSGEGYTNVDEHGVVTNRNHNFNEEGVCTQCGLHLISTADQLYAFAAKVNAGQTTISAKLAADIVVNENVLKAGTLTLNGTPANEWTPIGKTGYNFKGTFDGNGHTISGLYFNNTTNAIYPDSGNNIGLIGVADGATIKNVVVKDSYLRGSQHVAGICGYAYGSTQITNCGYEGYASGNYSCGIAYNPNATVENCYSVSNAPLADKATTNCYHDNTKYQENTYYSVGKSSESFANGEVAYMLGDAWGQKIGTDATPRLGGDKLYAKALCPHKVTTTNTECVFVPMDESDEQHYTSNGFCKECGAYQPAKLVDGSYEIDNVGKLYWFADKVNKGETTINAKLTADIMVNEKYSYSREWIPIGSSVNPFKGTFDGNGYVISGLYFNNTSISSGQYIGLIGYANGATIKNVVVKDSYLRGYRYVAGICGYSSGSTQITNCGFAGDIYGSESYGIAYNAIVENCYSVSNQLLASNRTSNCYYDKTKYTGQTYWSIGKSSEAFERGEIAWLLNGGSSDGVWGQNIGTESIPFIGGKKVYVTALCPHSFIGSNVEGSFTPIEDGDEHYDSDGYCKVCGAGQEPKLVGNYYEIAKVAHLYWFAEQVNSGNTSIRAKLIADIVVNKDVLKPGSLTLNGTPARKWVPIGMNFNTRYTGEFDGNGHTISGLYYDDTSYKDDNAHVGLIGYAERVWITNLIVKDSYLRGRKYVGGICGYADRCVMSRCGFEGYLYKSGSDGYNSGIAYDYNCRLENCFSRSNAPMGYNPYDSQLIFGCYHDKTLFAGTSTLSTGKTSEEFASGEVAYSIGIGQNIGIDESPSFGSAKVFKLSATVASGAHGTFSCASYANAGATPFTGEAEPGYEMVLKVSGSTIAYTGNTFNMPAANTTLDVDFVKANYTIAKESSYVGGTVTVKATAQYQDEVSISVVPDPGYVIETYELTDASGNAIAVTNGKFTMPASAVNVNVSFKPTGYVENGTVKGDWVVTSDYTIAAGETLVIPAGTTVTTYGDAVIINNGTLKVEDEISGVTLAGDGVFNYTTLSKYDVTFGTATYNGSAITIGNGLDVTYATKTFCGKTFTFDAESCTITYLNNVNASVGTRYAVVTWDFSGNTATKEFAILKRELNLTGFIANNKNYDGTTQATGSFSDDRIAGDELEFNYKCAFEDENVGTGKNVSFYRIEIDGGADADNYELVTTEGSASANINKAPLTIKANDFTINVGDEMPTFTVEYDGFVAAQNVEVLSTLPTVGVDITETSVDGTYDINVSGAEADNYEISYTKGTLTIKPDTATAIDEVASADVKIYAHGNTIVVENAQSPIEVYDITGSCLERRGDILDRIEIPVSNAGIYVVRTDNTAKKIIVK